jgi:hypothetical protein
MIPDRMHDPSGAAATVVSAVGAVLVLASEFGLPVTEGQQTAILGAAVVAGPWAAAWWTRKHAWSPEAHVRAVEQAETVGYRRGESASVKAMALRGPNQQG